MALIKCKDCGKNVSKKAKSCPKCGAPLKRNTLGCSFLFLFLVIIGVFSSIISSVNKEKAKSLPHAPNKQVKQNLAPIINNHEEKQAIQFCNMEILNNFNSSVTVKFPEPKISQNENAYFVHYKDDRKLITGASTRVDARCTVWKETYEITGLTIAGKSKI